jgi:hypothetical protein
VRVRSGNSASAARTSASASARRMPPVGVGLGRLIADRVFERALLAEFLGLRAAQRFSQERADHVARDVVDPGREAAEARIERPEVRVGAHERFLGQVGDVGRAADARADEVRDAAFVTVDQHGKPLAFAAEYELDQLFVGLLFDRHPPFVRAMSGRYPGRGRQGYGAARKGASRGGKADGMQLRIDSGSWPTSRRMAAAIVDPVSQPSSPALDGAVERAVLRLLGVDGHCADDVPLANRVVERLSGRDACRRRGRARSERSSPRPAPNPRSRARLLIGARRGAFEGVPARPPARRARRHVRSRPRAHRRPARRTRARTAGRLPQDAAAAALRDRGQRQHLRGPHRRGGRGRGRRADRRGHPLDRPVAARLRARTAPRPKASAAPTPRKRTSASCARRSTRSPNAWAAT